MALLLERAFVICARCDAAIASLQSVSAITTLEPWPATLGSPALPGSAYLTRGVEPHLHSRRCSRLGMPPGCGPANITGWGTVGNYVSHLTLLEHLASQRWSESAAFLVLQDDAELADDWVAALNHSLSGLGNQWMRVQLIWFGAERDADCTADFCAVHPPAGPTADAGTRFYHGLQAYLIRPAGARCLVERLRALPIKSIDALIVDADCPAAYAVRKAMVHRIGLHKRGSQKAKLDAEWRGERHRRKSQTRRS